MTIFKAELFVFLHDNTNISRLAENPEGRAPQGSFSCCTYLLNSEMNKFFTDNSDEDCVTICGYAPKIVDGYAFPLRDP